MNLWKKLFKKSGMKKIPGIYLSISKDEILSKDLSSISNAIDTVVNLTCKYDRLFCIELTFDVFDSDTRPIYEIPEIIAWAKAAAENFQDLTTWLTPGARLRHYLCLNPDMYQRLPDGRIELLLDTWRFSRSAAAIGMAASGRLKNAGMPSEKTLYITTESSQYLADIVNGKTTLGVDYMVYMPGLDQQQKANRYEKVDRYHSAGNTLSNGGDYNGAIKHYKRGLKIARKMDDQVGMADLYRKIGITLNNRGDKDGAIEHYQKSLGIYRDMDDQNGMAECHYSMGNAIQGPHSLDYNSSDVSDDNYSAIEHYQKSLEIYRDLDDQTGMAKCHYSMAYTLEYENDDDDSMGHYQKSLEIAEKIGDQERMADCYSRMGRALSYRDDRDDYIEHYKKSLEIAEKIGDQERMAACYYDMAKASLRRRRRGYDTAIEHYQKSLEIAEKIDNQAGMACCYHGIGHTLLLRRDYDGAIKYYQRSLEIFKDLDDQTRIASWIASCYSGISWALGYRGDYDGAIEHYQRSLEIAEKIGGKERLLELKALFSFIQKRQLKAQLREKKT